LAVGSPPLTYTIPKKTIMQYTYIILAGSKKKLKIRFAVQRI